MWSSFGGSGTASVPSGVSLIRNHIQLRTSFCAILSVKFAALASVKCPVWGESDAEPDSIQNVKERSVLIYLCIVVYLVIFYSG